MSRHDITCGISVALIFIGGIVFLWSSLHNVMLGADIGVGIGIGGSISAILHIRSIHAR